MRRQVSKKSTRSVRRVAFPALRSFLAAPPWQPSCLGAVVYPSPGFGSACVMLCLCRVVVVSCRAMSCQVSYSVMFRRYLWVDFASFPFVFGSRALLGRLSGGRPERGSLACTNECLRCAHACPSPSCALNLCRLALLACCGRSKVVGLSRPSLIFPWVLVGVLSVLMVQDDAADVGGTRCTYSRVLRLGWQRGCRASR